MNDLDYFDVDGTIIIVDVRIANQKGYRRASDREVGAAMRRSLPGATTRNQIEGFGDVVALIAEPIRRMIVRRAPKPIAKRAAECRCKARRDALNRAIPLRPRPEA